MALNIDHICISTPDASAALFNLLLTQLTHEYWCGLRDTGLTPRCHTVVCLQLCLLCDCMVALACMHVAVTCAALTGLPVPGRPCIARRQ